MITRVIIVIMIIIIEREWLKATKNTLLIFEDVTAKTLKQRRFKNHASSILYFQVFLVATFKTIPFLLISL